MERTEQLQVHFTNGYAGWTIIIYKMLSCFVCSILLQQDSLLYVRANPSDAPAKKCSMYCNPLTVVSVKIEFVAESQTFEKYEQKMIVAKSEWFTRTNHIKGNQQNWTKHVLWLKSCTTCKPIVISPLFQYWECKGLRLLNYQLNQLMQDFSHQHISISTPPGSPGSAQMAGETWI